MNKYLITYDNPKKYNTGNDDGSVEDGLFHIDDEIDGYTNVTCICSGPQTTIVVDTDVDSGTVLDAVIDGLDRNKGSAAIAKYKSNDGCGEAWSYKAGELKRL